MNLHPSLPQLLLLSQHTSNNSRHLDCSYCVLRAFYTRSHVIKQEVGRGDLYAWESSPGGDSSCTTTFLTLVRLGSLTCRMRTLPYTVSATHVLADFLQGK